MIEIRNVSFGYSEDVPVLKGVSAKFLPGRVTGVIGPNGSGKTTLFRLIAGLETPDAGEITLDGEPVRALSPKALARRLAVVPQSARMDFDFTVRDIVMMGRHAHIGRFQRPSARDIAAAEQAMRETGVSAFAEKFVTGLSGGEWQRVLIARALCQEAGTLLLDEPVSNLDLQYQLSTLRQMRALAREKNACVVCVLHTLNLAAHYCDDILLLWRGEVYKSGAPADVITPATLREVYGVEAVACPLPGGQTEVVPVY